MPASTNTVALVENRPWSDPTVAVESWYLNESRSLLETQEPRVC